MFVQFQENWGEGGDRSGNASEIIDISEKEGQSLV